MPSPTKRGGFDCCVIVLGAVGSGKSTHCVRLAHQLARDPGVYVLAHDIGHKLPDRLHDGTRSGIVRHLSVNAALARLKTSPAGIHAVMIPDAGAVISAGIRVAAASLQAHGGTRGYPCVVILDEGTSVSGASRYRLSDEMQTQIVQRRHHHIGLVVGAQSPKAIHYGLLGFASELVLYRLPDRKTHDRLAEVGVPDEVIDRVAKLPPHEYIVFRP